MSDNPAEAALNELKKWLELLKKLMAQMEAQKKALEAEQKAIGDKALAAHEKMVAKTKHDELMNELRDIKKGMQETPDGTPGKEEALKQVEEAEQKLKADDKALDQGQDLDNPDEIDNGLGEKAGQKEAQNLDTEAAGDLAPAAPALPGPGNDAGAALQQAGPALTTGGPAVAAGSPAGGINALASFGEKIANRPTRAGSVGADVMRDLQLVKDAKLGNNIGLGRGRSNSL